jgi:4-amino-4-deoxychorismate mutase
MEELLKFRKELDELDRKLIDTLAQRFAICRQVASYKAEHRIPMMQPGRVLEVKTRAAQRAVPAGLTERFALELYDLIISEACRMEDEIIESAETPVAVTAQG